jgi:hypothetical protein
MIVGIDVAFIHPVRNVGPEVRAERGQRLNEQPGGRHAINVKVAVDSEDQRIAHPEKG